MIVAFSENLEFSAKKLKGKSDNVENGRPLRREGRKVISYRHKHCFIWGQLRASEGSMDNYTYHMYSGHN